MSFAESSVLPTNITELTAVAIEAQRKLRDAEARMAHAERRAIAAEATLADEQATRSAQDTLIAHLKLTIAKLQRDKYGVSSERSARLLDQMELQLEEAEANLTEDELAAEQAGAKTTTVASFSRKTPSKKPLPEHLPRERVVVTAPAACQCCGGARLAKLGEDITETLEVVPRQWKVIQTVREKFTCRDCERISQSPAPFHAIPRGSAGPHLLAMIAFEKFGQHQPLNRQAERYAREGVDLSLSTMAGYIGTLAMVLRPLHDLIVKHVMGAERLFADDTTVPVLAKGQTTVGRIWTYLRDDGPFNGPSPPAAVYYYSPDRRREHPLQHLAHYRGILQVDAYSGYNELFKDGRSSGAITPAFCMAHARRNFFKLADIEGAARAMARGEKAKLISPIAQEVVRRMDELFEIERTITGQDTATRLAVRQQRSAPLVTALEAYMRDQQAKLSKHADVAKAMEYMFRRWEGFTAFLRDGRICLTNNAAERGLRGIALGRKSWLFCGSDRGGDRAAVMYGLVVTAKMNDIDPQRWLADVLARMPDHPARRLDELLPWNWKQNHHR